jgi:hypothetical protein
MGLTDMPGGAANGGAWTLLIGLGLFLTERKPLLKFGGLAGMPIAMFVIYLSQMRSVLVMSLACVAAIIVVIALRGEIMRVISLLIIIGALVIGTFGWAVAVGGDAVTGRLSTLVDDRADEIYYQNRGHFLSDTFYIMMPEYPLGAGLGRWGMTNFYFGNDDNPDNGMIWAEIQWTGWLLDGGVPLMVAYCLAILIACAIALKIALDRRLPVIGIWGAIIVACNTSACAAIFNHCYFVSQDGLDFWMLNAALFGMYRYALATGKPPSKAPQSKPVDCNPPAFAPGGAS